MSTSLNGSWSLEVVARKLKASWTYRDLNLRDKSMRKTGVNFAGEDESTMDEGFDVFYGHDSEGWSDGYRGTDDEWQNWQGEDYSYDDPDATALQDHCSEAQVMAVSAHRTFLEAKQMLQM